MKHVNIPEWYSPEILIAILAFVVSVISLWLTIRALCMQRRHNQLSMIPFGRIILGDYEDEIFVKLVNAGVGPLIISQVLVTDGNSTFTNLIDIIKTELPRGLEWKDFVDELENRVIKVDDELLLIQITKLDKPTTKDDVKAYEDFKKDLRRTLSKITITFRYQDVYGNGFTEVRGLSWFGRHESISQQLEVDIKTRKL